MLLIVPYGIETEVKKLARAIKELLIVPYGIETTENKDARIYQHSFNRTLWN